MSSSIIGGCHFCVEAPGTKRYGVDDHLVIDKMIVFGTSSEKSHNLRDKIMCCEMIIDPVVC